MVPPSKFIKPELLIEGIRQNFRIIDVRSPSEFMEDHVPGAINLPVLNDVERERVGILYKEDNFEAKKIGARIISRNISKILKNIDEIDFGYKSRGLRKPESNFIVYCWRGGMRSTALFTVMDMIGYKTYVLDGGYRAYRQWINEFLNNLKMDRVLVLHGPSGTGKTKILEHLKADGIYPVNLEKLANHNGSVFGEKEQGQPSQKQFETNLVEALLDSKPQDLFILEGESRKIGKLRLPESLNNILLRAKKVWIELPIERRSEFIASEYEFTEQKFGEKLNYLRRYLSVEVLKDIENSFQNKDFIRVSTLLLKYHYDIMYRKSYKIHKHPEEMIIHGNSIEFLIEKIRLLIKENYF